VTEQRAWADAEAELLAEIRDRIWYYLSSSSSPRQLLLEASALLQIPLVQAAELGRVHFLAGDEVRRLIEALPGILRHLATTTRSDEEISFDRVSGPIRWGPTLALRASSGLQTGVVTAPAFRAYQTPENEVLVFVLRQIVQLSRTLGWLRRSGWLSSRVGQSVDAATRALGSRALQSVAVRKPSVRTLRTVRSGRRIRYGPAVAAFDALERLVLNMDRAAVRDTVETAALTASRPDRLLELACLFDVIEALRREESGWSLSPLRLFHGRLHLAGKRKDDTIDLWFQTIPKEFREQSVYTAVQSTHGFMHPSSRIPDFVIRRTQESGSSWLIGEIKLRSDRSVEVAARDALADLLSYRQDFRGVLDLSPEPYGLGIAWGRAGPELLHANSEVMLVTRAGIPQAIAAFAD
jgi:hypothetical protein